MNYEVVIGLEVHVELHTRSKLFCGCPNDFSAEPNTNVCEVCLGFPGTLPYLNAGAVDQALKTALALNCEIALCSRFDRKNYFYPDTPKGYQITQYFRPIGEHGYLEIEGPDIEKKVIGIDRVHIEEDAGKLVHSPAGDCSMVDFNRAGVPLVEIVSDPDLRSPVEARCYLERLKSILQYARVSDCKMEEGSLRCDANISLRPHGHKQFGVKTELKKMNSFRAVERALEYEIRRQAEILDGGGEVIPETRRWDEESGETAAMRSKLEAGNYRYFTDPELAPVELTAAHVEKIRSSLPEFAPQRI
ncbi:MAG: Asp-tRNA(Asn)/Glu-tRNA(Gln) amidotransferase subunit GatB, partial [Dethiobacteria bacterium]